MLLSQVLSNTTSFLLLQADVANLSSSLSSCASLKRPVTTPAEEGNENWWALKKTFQAELKNNPFRAHQHRQVKIYVLLLTVQPSKTWGTDLRVPPNPLWHCRATAFTERYWKYSQLPSSMDILLAKEDTQRFWEAISKGNWQVFPRERKEEHDTRGGVYTLSHLFCSNL